MTTFAKKENTDVEYDKLCKDMLILQTQTLDLTEKNKRLAVEVMALCSNLFQRVRSLVLS